MVLHYAMVTASANPVGDAARLRLLRSFVEVYFIFLTAGDRSGNIFEDRGLRMGIQAQRLLRWVSFVWEGRSANEPPFPRGLPATGLEQRRRAGTPVTGRPTEVVVQVHRELIVERTVIRERENCTDEHLGLFTNPDRGANGHVED